MFHAMDAADLASSGNVASPRSPREVLFAAHTDFAARVERLLALRRITASGGRPSAADLDAALRGYTEASARLNRAWSTWHNAVLAAERAHASARLASHLSDATVRPIAAPILLDIPSDPLPNPPTPRLRFARWLFETGRLSDWPTA